MDFGTWLAFVAASLALLVIPGPTVLLAISYALSRGRRVALATVAGVTLGDIIAMTAPQSSNIDDAIAATATTPLLRGRGTFLHGYDPPSMTAERGFPYQSCGNR